MEFNPFMIGAWDVEKKTILALDPQRKKKYIFISGNSIANPFMMALIPWIYSSLDACASEVGKLR